MQLILEPIFEADFQPGSYGYRPGRTAHEAVDRVRQAIREGKTRVIDLDLKSRAVDLARGGSFGILGFDIRRVRSRSGRWFALAIPKLKKRTELLAKLSTRSSGGGSTTLATATLVDASPTSETAWRRR